MTASGASVAGTTGRWSLAGSARLASVEDPGYPSASERALSLSASYAVGMVVLTLENRLMVTTRQGQATTADYLLLRVARRVR